MKKTVLLFAFLFQLSLYAQVPSELGNRWVDSVFQKMSLDEKIGQLFMVRAFGRMEKEEMSKVKSLIRDEKVGGVCFFQGEVAAQTELTNLYQKLSDIPLFIAIDGEWGLGMRHKNEAISYPRQLTLGAIQDNNLIYEMGKDIAEQCRRMGINMNFAPVVDVNNNVNNPVIYDRSFGEDKINVAAKAYAYMQGLQEGGVIACAKHFPGHGDTDVDSHYDLPVIKHSRERLDDIELFPFKAMINMGIKSIMVAHLSVPALDGRNNRATTLSRPVVHDLLREKLNFEGLIITDALEMKGVTKHFEPGIADAEAFMAGNDILLLSENVKKAKEVIREYIKAGKISMQQLNESVLRILNAKSQFHIPNYRSLEVATVTADINQKKYLGLKTRLIEASVTAASNKNKLVPIKSIDKNYVTIAFGEEEVSPFQKRLKNYLTTKDFTVSGDISNSLADEIESNLAREGVAILSVSNYLKSPKSNFGLSEHNLEFIRALDKKYPVIVVLFGSPYALARFEGINTVVMAYEDDALTQDIVAQSLVGVNEITGKLPITASASYKFDQGVQIPSLGRLGFSIPERVGMHTDTLSAIEKIVEELISKKAAPGCQVLIARAGKIVYQKSFGAFDYTNKRMVKNDDLYDLASITKVMSTTLAVMKLYDEGKIDLYKPINQYIQAADTTNKKDMNLAEMMAHHAGLKPWIPFYASTLETLDHKVVLPERYYSRTEKENFNIQVATDLYLRNDYRDTIWDRILTSELRESNSYRYSDLGFYLTGLCVENRCNVPLDEYVQHTFYKPLGLRRTGYKPKHFINYEDIAPSEEDKYFRSTVLQGDVHDMGAAMLGGSSGHAGLFSNAYEVGILSQMLLNGGRYGGKSFLNASTINRFTTRFYRSSRRAIGFDMKELDAKKSLNMSEFASNRAYGHYGFTGTAVFIDPVYDLIYVFLSNRTYPSMTNNLLNKEDFRSRIHTVAYKAMF